MARRLSCIVVLCLIALACASLDGLRALIQPPRFEQADGRRSEIRLTGPTVDSPAGGASVRLWARVSNPNGFGLTLGMLRGTLNLEGSRAATVNFPLGLPLQARGEQDVPIDIMVSFQDVPGLGSAISRALSRQPIVYELEGTISVSAGAFGEPVFGPMTLLTGEIR
ncbi:MAG: LEA type 2 family protein [Acidobacteria bacterium]|nr:LEA type 2 family protein [Acidobacteriota bacterium]